MNYVKLIGGLGNQLFQYAYALHLLKKYKNVKLDISEFKYYELHKLKIQNYKIILNFSEWNNVSKFYIFKNLYISYRIKIFSKKLYIFLHRKLNNYSIIYENSKFKNLNDKDHLHEGYYQNLKFIEPNKKQLLNQIKLKRYSKKHKRLLDEILKKKNSVAIQIRLYSKTRAEDEYHGNISPKYINKAKKKIESKIKKPFYYIFTNSNDWVYKNLKLTGSNYKLVKCFEDYEDLQSISKCKHQIISNSTFGWWGAWLNGNNSKIVIVPKNWYAKEKNPKNLIPKNWIKI